MKTKCFLLLALSIVVVGPVFAGGQAEPRAVNRLIVGYDSPPAETNRIWNATWVNFLQFEPMLETLIGSDPETGEPIPRLATDWEANEDFTTWTFNLRPGVQFHFGYGEFTAQDVKHTYELLSRDDSQINMAETWQDLVREVEIIDDYTVAFHFSSPYIHGERLFSRTGGELYIVSKAQWDEGGAEAMDARLVGTGVYRFKERNIGQNLVVEAVENHWRDTAPFDELEMRWIPDATTRMSQLVAGEIHAAALPRDVTRAAVNSGMRVIPSRRENMQQFVAFGGLYFHSGPPETEANNPLLDRKVRKALIRAVDLEEIQEELFGGRMTPTPLPGWHPLIEGWSDEYGDRWEELYSYDPVRARELLEESSWNAGDINLRLNDFPHPGQPESPDVLQALQGYWREIGVNATISAIEYGAFLQRWFEQLAVHGEIYITRNTPIRTNQDYISFWHTGAARGRNYTSDFIEERYEELVRTFNPERREALAREIGEYLMEQAPVISLGSTHVEIVVDPAVIEDWVWSGWAPTGYTHYYEIVPANR